MNIKMQGCYKILFWIHRLMIINTIWFISKKHLFSKLNFLNKQAGKYDYMFWNAIKTEQPCILVLKPSEKGKHAMLFMCLRGLGCFSSHTIVVIINSGRLFLVYSFKETVDINTLKGHVFKLFHPAPPSQWLAKAVVWA